MKESDRKSLLESYKSAHPRLLQALASIPVEIWQYQPGPTDWSIHEVILHLADSETHMYIRARRFIAEPGSKVLAFDHDKWTAALDYHSQDVGDALELFKYLRELTYGLLLNVPAETWKNTVEHSEFGVMTMHQWLERADKHANDHITQIKNNHQLWLKKKPCR